MVVNKKAVSVVLALLVSQSALALNLQGYHFSDSYRYSILDDSLQEKFEGKYVFTTNLGHVNSPFYYSDRNLNGVDKKIIDYNTVLTTGFSYYVNKNVSVGIDLNAIHNTVFNSTYTSLADTVVKSRLNVHRTKTFSLSLNPQVILPTGKKENFSTMGSVSGSLSAVAEKSFNKLHFLASVGGLSSKNNAYSDVDHRQLLLTQLGISYDVAEKLNLNLESYRNIPLVNDKLQDEGKYFLTAKHQTHKNFSTYAGAGLSGFDKAERHSYSAFFGLKFHEATQPVVTSTITSVAAAPKRVASKEEELALGPPAKMDEIYFAHAKHDLETPEVKKLDEVVHYINEFKAEIHNIVIEGFASRVGSPEFNLRLSNQRAVTVKDYFVDHGVSKDILSVVGYGDKTEQNPDEKKNRKVQFRIHK